jgi:hypothetical protein
VPRELSKGGQRPTVKLSVWSHGRQTARKKGISMVKSIIFEPQNVSELKLFFEDNKEKYLEIWVVITKKKVANPQPLSFDQASTEAKKQELIDSQTKTIDAEKYMICFTKRIKPKTV